MEMIMNTKSVKSIFALFVAFGLISSCSNKKNDSEAIVNKAFSVRVATVAQNNGKSANYYIGIVEADKTIPLSFPMPGTVQKVNVSEGQNISAGAVLASLDAESVKQNLEISIAREKQALDAFERLNKAYKEGGIPEIKFVEVKTGLEQAKAAVLIAKKSLNDCVLKSPISGTIGKRMIEPGANVAPFNPVFMIYKIDNINIKVPVPENEISKLKKGQTANITIAALGDKTFLGKIDEIGVVASPVSHTYDVKISIRNNGQLIKPGMACQVSIDGLDGAASLLVPNNAVQGELNKQFVYVVNNDKVAKRYIKSAGYNANSIIIVDGLKEGEQVVISGAQKLFDNAKISILK